VGMHRKAQSMVHRWPPVTVIRVFRNCVGSGFSVALPSVPNHAGSSPSSATSGGLSPTVLGSTMIGVFEHVQVRICRQEWDALRNQ